MRDQCRLDGLQSPIAFSYTKFSILQYYRVLLFFIIAVNTQASSDRECPMSLQRHLSNIFNIFYVIDPEPEPRTLTLNPKP